MVQFHGKSRKRKGGGAQFWFLGVVIGGSSIAVFLVGVQLSYLIFPTTPLAIQQPISSNASYSTNHNSPQEEEEEETHQVLVDDIISSSLKNNATQEEIVPFITAFNEQGEAGYIHDPYYVKNHPLPFTYSADGREICTAPLGRGQEGPRGIYGLRKIQIASSNKAKTRIFCMVYSYDQKHDVIRSIAETYGQRCDGFMVGSNKTELNIGAVNIEHNGPEEYNNMWEKVRAMWIYVYQHYLDDFDWFHIGGDNMFVIADNLRYAMSFYNASEPHYMGAAIVDRKMMRRRYCGGGAGYTLSAQAVRLMIEDNFRYSRCWPNRTRSDEDRLMGTCLRLKVAKCTQNMDHLNESRYHHYDVEFHTRWDRRKPSNWGWRPLLEKHNIIAYKERLETISATTISFHITSNSVFQDRGMRRYHALLYGLCDKEEMQLRPLPQNFTFKNPEGI